MKYLPAHLETLLSHLPGPEGSQGDSLHAWGLVHDRLHEVSAISVTKMADMLYSAALNGNLTMHGVTRD
jgi:hypothetical protein